MSGVNIADAKAQFSALVDRAAAGEHVQILRRGKPVAQIVPVPMPRKPIDFAALRALTDAMPVQQETGSDLVRRMRDGERY